VIARAGAGTVFETARFGLPALFVPYPGACGHQKANASYLVERKAGIMIEEDKLSPETMLSRIRCAINDSVGLKQMGETARKLFEHDTGERLVRIVENMIEEAYADSGR